MSPELRDAAQGVLWEDRFRGRLEDHPDQEFLLHRAKKWLVTTPPTVPDPRPDDRPGNPIGWGSYRWGYRPDVVEKAVELGAGVIDTAETYGYGKVETELGKVFKRTPPGDTWVVSKVARNHTRSSTAVVSAGRRSRDRLNLPSIDLYLIHWPVVRDLPAALDGMASLLEEGTVKRVGVSNFCWGQTLHVASLASERGITLHSNQSRLSPRDPGAAGYLFPRCKEWGLVTFAHSPLGQGDLKTAPADSIRWVMAKADVVLVGTNDPGHLRSNLSLCKNHAGTTPA